METSIRTGRDLAAERVRAGLLQRDVARAMGVSTRRIGAIEWKLRVQAAMASRYLNAIDKAVRDAA